ncbi:hypothetical protein PybrP1_010596 [[Pythium] brassicae (nom. inval.)]|nr:hypothetical protein PybrP1_010596 [[Pythium] brassicae (nom. inval.)]
MTVRSCVAQFHQNRHDSRIREQRRALRERRAAAMQANPSLSLEGWHAYREQLIHHEQQQLGEKEGSGVTLSVAT